jgi:hypothetical protein
MRNAFWIPFFILSVFSFSASATEGSDGCIKAVTILENMLDAEKIKFANDKCALLKAAAATRAAMLNEINKDPHSCGFKPEIISTMKRQYENYTRMQESICR